MIEIMTDRSDFEQKSHTETEQKFLPVFPEQLNEYRKEALPIEQFYVSHPSEDFSLRFREASDENGALHYHTTLKDRGHVTNAGLARLEVETAVSPELYNYYRADNPAIRKLRACVEGVEIDFFEDGHVQLEAENPAAWANFTVTHGNAFMDVSGERVASSEWRAHLRYRHEHEGSEALVPLTQLDSEAITRDILTRLITSPSVFVKICGRSGSGKSTIVRKVQEKLTTYGLGSIVISTDDYHRGASWLRSYNNGQEWTDWDADIVYDTAKMAEELAQLQSGEPILKRSIDWRIAEPITGEEIQPAPIIIIEGIYAGHPNFDALNALSYDMPTPLATCIGRRLLRDIRERPQFADPEASLTYMLEHAEPAWRAQQAGLFKTQNIYNTQD